MKRALITGVTGQDGAYLSHLLLDQGYLWNSNSFSHDLPFFASRAHRKRK